MKKLTKEDLQNLFVEVNTQEEYDKLMGLLRDIGFNTRWFTPPLFPATVYVIIHKDTVEWTPYKDAIPARYDKIRSVQHLFGDPYANTEFIIDGEEEYNFIMEKLEEAGYTWPMGSKPTEPIYTEDRHVYAHNDHIISEDVTEQKHYTTKKVKDMMPKDTQLITIQLLGWEHKFAVEKRLRKLNLLSEDGTFHDPYKPIYIHKDGLKKYTTISGEMLKQEWLTLDDLYKIEAKPTEYEFGFDNLTVKYNNKYVWGEYEGKDFSIDKKYLEDMVCNAKISIQGYEVQRDIRIGCLIIKEENVKRLLKFMEELNEK